MRELLFDARAATGELPYELSLVLGRPFMITNDIDVADGLSNGTVGK